MVIVDFILALLSMFLSYVLLKGSISTMSNRIIIDLFVFVFVVIIVFSYVDLYNYSVFLNRLRYLYRTTKGILYSFFVYLIWLWLFKANLPQPALFPIVLFIIFAGLTYFSRIFILPLFSVVHPNTDVVIFAPEGEYNEIEVWINENRDNNIIIKEIITEESDIENYLGKNIPVIISTVTSNWERLFNLIFKFKNKNPIFLFSPLISGIENVDYWPYIYDIPLVNFRWNSHSPSFLFFKRIIDIIGATVALIIFSPIMIISAIAVKMTSDGPVFFRQKRLSRIGEKFYMLKFRSMFITENHDKHREFVKNFINGNDCDKGVYKMTDDPRITPIGNILRKTSIDEFPQFFNVLNGDLSLVGPRPPIDYEINEYSEWQKDRLSVKQGLTGVWQIFGRSKLPFDKSCFLDIYYAENRSLWMDLHLITLTLPTIVFGQGAY